MTFVNNDQIKEARAEFFKNFLAFLWTGDGLVQPQVNLIRGVDAAFVVGAPIHSQRQLNLAPVCTFYGFGIDTELGHGAAKRAKVIDHGLVNQDVAVGEKQNTLLLPRLPQPPDDLKCRVGLTGACGHDQQDAVLTFGNGFHCSVDGVALVIARLFARAVVKVGLLDHFFLCRGQTLPCQITAPERCWAGKVIQLQCGFQLHRCACAVMQHETVAIAGENEWNVERSGVIQRLLHTIANSFEVVLGLNQSNREVPDIQHIVGPLGLATRDQLTSHDDPARRECHLATNSSFNPTRLV